MPEPTDAEFLRHVTENVPLPMMDGLRLRAIASRLDKLDKLDAEQCQPVRDPSPGEPVPSTGCVLLLIVGGLLWLL